MRTYTALVPICALFLLGLTAPAYAHRVNVFAHEDNGRVKVEAYFSSGAKAAHSDVLVYGPDAALLLQMKTDENGECSFTPAAPEHLTIVVTTPDGHRSECTLQAAEVTTPGAQDAPPRNNTGKNERHTADDDATPSVAALKAELDITRAELRELQRARDRVSFRDVIAGLGFIFGATSLAAWLNRNRSSATNEG